MPQRRRPDEFDAARWQPGFHNPLATFRSRLRRHLYSSVTPLPREVNSTQDVERAEAVAVILARPAHVVHRARDQLLN